MNSYSNKVDKTMMFSSSSHQNASILLFFILFILFSLTSSSSYKPLMRNSIVNAIPNKTNKTCEIETKKHQTILPWISDGVKSGIASGLAAAIAKIVLQPFDTIKTVQQAEKSGLNPLNAGLYIIKNRGIGGLWSGMGITVIGSSPSVAVYFGIYSSMKKILLEKFPLHLHLLGVAIAASIGNTIASVLRVPYEVISFGSLCRNAFISIYLDRSSNNGYKLVNLVILGKHYHIHGKLKD